MCVSFSTCPLELPGWGVVTCRVTASREPSREVHRASPGVCEKSRLPVRTLTLETEDDYPSGDEILSAMGARGGGLNWTECRRLSQPSDADDEDADLRFDAVRFDPNAPSRRVRALEFDLYLAARR
jgi:hypothetical protein